MRGNPKYRKLWAVLMLLAMAGVTHAEDDPMNDPGVQKLLRATANASTWYHPDLFGEFAGTRYYVHHKYQDALKYFEIGALYADKLSQLCIGLMYMNGEGTKKDPITAYAWLDLAAERNYPDFVATRDRVKASLTAEQLAQATLVRKTLAERYADAVAKPRMAGQLRLGQMQMTGSHTGFNSGIEHVNLAGSSSSAQNCAETPMVGGHAVPQAGCGSESIYDNERWEPNLYFASRDREYKATVTVGAVEEQGKAIDKPPSSAAPVDAPADKGVQNH